MSRSMDCSGGSQDSEQDQDVINMSPLATYTERERNFFSSLEGYWSESSGTVADKLACFARFVPRQSLANFLAKEKIFKRISNLHGHIIECGVFRGAGMFAWSQLSAIYEPYNHVRRVIGFDTFSGFPGMHELDGDESLPFKQPGGLASHSQDEIVQGIAMQDLNRPLGHLPKCELVIGDACETIPNFVESNQHLVDALLYLDFDLYLPTKIAIESFWPRMPKGSVIAFDELNQSQWPGETMAVLDSIGIDSIRIERFEFNPQISFAVKE